MNAFPENKNFYAAFYEADTRVGETSLFIIMTSKRLFA